MSNAQREQIGWWIEVIFKVGTPISVLSIGAVILWLNSNYVTRAELREFTTRLETVEKILIRMEEGRATDERHQRQLDDHEARLRLLEAKR